MEIVIEYFPHIISGIAIILSILSFYYIHLQGPVLRIEHLSKKRVNLTQKTSTTYEHITTVINEGNKIGIIKQISAVIDTSDSNFKIERLRGSYIYRGAENYEINEDTPYAVIPIAPKILL